MDEMIHRVAFAIYTQDCQGDPITAWEDLPPETLARYMVNAHAAIYAMREPDEVAIQRAYEAVEFNDCWQIEDGPEFLKAYHAVIDAALSVK